ncbi:hypothetical protein [Methylobacterium iners]|jgi:NADPH-dependent 2,4-dienoyl-CoA reductase/sulfur reductase-like enzyme|uniref:Argininosuccinate lyase n=1 Tax=Methylobacterium iners TaxID=418707 RepID=A0ABQ4S0X1_9HYPH|nr:hypothetical protein [Methylobacterium iners]GJD96511.1 hypothetical protein OCOJLMKI_3732 [Methylobacterium iners]
MLKVSLVALGAAALCVASLAGASAANRRVDIVNNTGMVISEFYASNTGSDNWEEDILGRDVIADGETFDINIDDGTGKCRFDFKAVFDNGKSLVRNNINVCQISTFTYTR